MNIVSLSKYVWAKLYLEMLWGHFTVLSAYPAVVPLKAILQ